MKKIYSKPEIVFESFAMSTNIAAGCENKTNTPAKMQCAYGTNDYDMPLFLEGVSACKATTQENDTLCYNVPIESNNIFNS